jgi:hypothetical protein
MTVAAIIAFTAVTVPTLSSSLDNTLLLKINARVCGRWLSDWAAVLSVSVLSR